MPKVELREKKALMKKVQKAFTLIDRKISSEEVNRILNDPERDRIHELGEKLVETRKAYSFFIENHYPEYQGLGFPRLLPHYLDMSGTPEADKKNRELLESLKTEEGKTKFARKAASEILSMDMKSLLPTGDIKKDIDFYAKHAREIELCWAVQDLENHGKEYLDPAAYELLEDRKPMLQVAGQYYNRAELTAHDYYTVMPEITPEERMQMDNDDDIERTGVDELFAADLNLYNSHLQVLQEYQNDKMGVVMKKAIEMEEDGELTPFTIAVNEKGERMKLSDGIDASLKGENITFKENTDDKNIIASYINKVSHPIQMPKEKNTSLYDAFSAEALSAQGKELQKECQRLSKIMDGAKLWYTSGSEQFRETDNLLKEMASGELLNKDQALEKMNKILAYCEKYISEKDEDTLKEREKKRLDAMKEVKKSLFPKRELLALIKIRGDSRRYEAAEGLGDKKQLFHTSTENQKNFHVAESDRKAAQYRKEVEGYRGERGVMGKLAANIEKTVTKLSNDAVSESNAGYRPKIVTDSRLPRSIAEIAIFEFIREERALAKKHNETVAKGKTEAALDKLSANKDDWYKMIGEIADTKTVKKLAEDIANNSGKTAEFFMNQGPKKLLADLKKELTAKAPSANKENKQAEAKKIPEKKEMKKAGI